MANNYVIGGGLSGLVYAAFHPDTKVITSPCVPVMTDVRLMPLILHYDALVARWLRGLIAAYRCSDQAIPTQMCVVEYRQPDGSFGPCVSHSMAKEYFLKSRMLGFTDRQFEGHIDTSFRYFGIDLAVLQSALQWALGPMRIIQGNVIRITPSEIVMDGGTTVEYETLVSTLPAPVFYDLYQGWCHRPSFSWVSKWFKVAGPEEMEYAPLWLRNFDKMGYVYIPQNIEFGGLIRINNLGGALVTEYVEPVQPGNFRKVEYGYFTKPAHPVHPPTPFIKFVGRFAEWDEEVLIHDIIKRYL